MTTSEFNPSGLKRALDGRNQSGSGAPFDPADLARAANAFFSALPGQEPDLELSPNIQPQVLSAAEPVSAAPASQVPTPEVPEVGTLYLEELPLSLPDGGSITSLQGGNLPGFALPSLPGQGFYFLDGLQAPAVPAVAPTIPASSANIPSAVPGLASVDPIATTPVQTPALIPTADFYQPQLVPITGAPAGFFDPYTVRKDFPILNQQVHGRPLVWLDNAATTQKPQAVIDRLSRFYETENSNIHRAAHALAARATDAYEGAREKVRTFLNAPSSSNIVFTRGTTEAINLVAQSWGRKNIGAGDEIVVSWLEHHANIVPWQQLASETGARLRVIPVDDRGQIILEEYERLLGPRTKLVSVTQVSNALGTVTPVQELIAIAHRHGIRILIDGAQSVSHMPVDVQALDCDFLVFSGHKIFAPTGIGALYGKQELLDAMPPWQGGGNMIADVTFERTVYQGAPNKFEAGTGNIADAVGLGEALDYVQRLGREAISRHEHDLIVYATDGLTQIPGLRTIGTAAEKAGVISFVLEGLRSEDVGSALDKHGIAVRSGHHCAQPILRRFGVEATVRPSFAPYNTREDIDALVQAVQAIKSGR